MRTPSWETSAGALVAFLNSATQRVTADLLTITLTSGQVLRYSGGDQALTVNGNTFGLGPLIVRSRTSQKVGIDVDSLDLTLSCDSSVQVNGSPLLAFARLGGFDAARVVLERAYAASWATGVVGTVALFSGRVGPGVPTRYDVRFTVKSELELLDVMVPRNVYQAGCLNDLFEPSTCRILRAAWTYAGSATGPTDATQTVFANTLVNGGGWFDLGVVRFSSGANLGVSRTVRSYQPGSLTVIAPWPFPVANGDTFTASAGCNKTLLQCDTKFNNRVNFRGQPFIPVPETIT